MPSHPQPDWLAWAAGIVDGEGCIQLVRHNKKRRGVTWAIRLSVGNTDLRILLKLRELFSGAICDKGKSPLATRPAWTWVVSCKNAERALTLIRPWLVGKADQADVALASRRLLRTNGPKHQFTDLEVAEFDRMAQQIRYLKRALPTSEADCCA